MMTIRQMQIFAAAARHGSFRACADQLGLSQVVVSTHIRAIEKHLGVDLFERRTGRPAGLTERGRHAYERIAAILADIEDLGRELTGTHGRRVLRFTTYSFILLQCEDRLDEFRALCPDIDLQIAIQPPNNQELAAAVQRGEVDLACFFTANAAEVPGSRLLYETELAAYAGVDHPLAGQHGVTGAMLAEHPMMALPKSDPQRTLTDKVLEAIGCSPRKVFMETDALALMLHHVRRAHAWICLYSQSIDENTPRLKRLDLAQALPPIQVRSLSRASVRHDPALRTLLACLQSGERGPLDGLPAAAEMTP